MTREYLREYRTYFHVEKEKDSGMKGLADTSLSATQKLAIKMNRLKASKPALEHHITQKDYKNRKKRTRTLIQMRGLIQLSGLMALCDLHEGDDLQNNILARDKAALLLGILLEAVERFEPSSSPELQKKGHHYLGK